MHIQEGTNTTLTTCTKMTEEVDRRHGVNGNSSGKGASDDAAVHNSALTATGGRLKFFKGQYFDILIASVAGAWKVALADVSTGGLPMYLEKRESHSCSDNYM